MTEASYGVQATNFDSLKEQALLLHLLQLGLSLS